MKQESKRSWILAALLVAAGGICAVAASVCRAMCRIDYLTLDAQKSAPQQAASS